MVANTQH